MVFFPMKKLRIEAISLLPRLMAEVSLDVSWLSFGALDSPVARCVFETLRSALNE